MCTMVKLAIFIFLRKKSWKKRLFLHEMLNIRPILAQYLYNIILRFRVESILGC